MKNLSIILITTIVVIVLCLVLLNSQLVSVNYIVGHGYIRLSILLLITFASGVIFGYGWRNARGRKSV